MVTVSLPDDLERIRECGVAACTTQVPEAVDTHDSDKLALVLVDPRVRRQPTGCPVDALTWHVFLKDKRDHSWKETLQKVEDIGNGRTDLADRLEDITVKDHLPLDASVGREEGARMDRELELERWASRVAGS